MKRRHQHLVLGAALLATMIGVAEADVKPPGTPDTDEPPTKSVPVWRSIADLTTQVNWLNEENARLHQQLACFQPRKRTHGRTPIVVYICAKTQVKP